MKTFARTLAFFAVFISATMVGALYAAALWEQDIKSPGHPIAAVIVGVVSVCVGALGGRYAARATSQRYEQRENSRYVA